MFEPKAEKSVYGTDTEKVKALNSIAISLKRIADAMEKQCIPNYNIVNRLDTIC